MKQEFLNSINKLTKHASLRIKKYSPEALMGLGVVGVIGSTVLACIATTKVSEIIENKKEQIDQVHECLEDPDIDYTEEDSKKDLTIIYVKTGLNLLKIYAPAIILGSLSLSTIISSHAIMKKRNVALAAAYATVDKGFKNYRKNVVERFGESVDKELRYNIKTKEIETKYIDKNGKEKTKKEQVMTIDNPTQGISDYARFFDEWTSDDYRKDSEYNLMFLRRQQDYANEKLKVQGHLFLNEVYDMLGIPRSKEGQIVGWIYDKDNPSRYNYVDFGIYNLSNLSEEQKERKMAFVNGYERSILLDFNVDGPIYELLDSNK
jgi:hypothetical protein